jgi:hypothetical protein
MNIKSSLIPVVIIIIVIGIYFCDGNVSCNNSKMNIENTPFIGKKAYSVLNIHEDNSYWNRKSVITSPIKIGVLSLAENTPNVPLKRVCEVIEHKEITLIEDGFLLKFFHVLHLKENRENTREPGSYGELGPYQIRRAFWIDGCKQLGVNINSREWCYDINVWIDAKCRAVIQAYFEKYKVPNNR